MSYDAITINHISHDVIIYIVVFKLFQKVPGVNAFQRTTYPVPYQHKQTDLHWNKAGGKCIFEARLSEGATLVHFDMNLTLQDDLTSWRPCPCESHALASCHGQASGSLACVQSSLFHMPGIFFCFFSFMQVGSLSHFPLPDLILATLRHWLHREGVPLFH